MQNCFGLELMPFSPQKAKVTFGPWYSWASAGDAQALTSACRYQSGFILWMCLCAKVLFIRAKTCFQQLFFSPSSVLSPSGNSYPTNSRCLSFTCCPKFSADPQKTEAFSGRQRCGYATVNWNRTTSASFSQKTFSCSKSRNLGFKPCLIFPFCLQHCKCKPLGLWVHTVNEGEENWNLKINFFFFNVS